MDKDYRERYGGAGEAVKVVRSFVENPGEEDQAARIDEESEEEKV